MFWVKWNLGPCCNEVLLYFTYTQQIQVNGLYMSLLHALSYEKLNCQNSEY